MFFFFHRSILTTGKAAVTGSTLAGCRINGTPAVSGVIISIAANICCVQLARAHPLSSCRRGLNEPPDLLTSDLGLRMLHGWDKRSSSAGRRVSDLLSAALVSLRPAQQSPNNMGEHTHTHTLKTTGPSEKTFNESTGDLHGNAVSMQVYSQVDSSSSGQGHVLLKERAAVKETKLSGAGALKADLHVHTRTHARTHTRTAACSGPAV